MVVKRPLYEKRHKLISQIPNFWTLVFEQAPPDIDEFIQPSDSSLLLTSLTSLSVSRFETENGGKGDPRSLCFRFEFSGNDHFEDEVIEKKFWHRRSRDGWSGLVSEPVEIRWKKGKDLTGGLLGTVRKVWAAQQAEAKTKAGGANPKDLTADERALKKKIENTGLGGLSFFAWFGYVGRNISAEESQEATEKARKERVTRQEGGNSTNGDGEDEDGEDDDDDDDDENELEIFPEGENLAIAISEDLWPGAIKYFSKYGKAISEEPVLNISQPKPKSRTKSAMMISSPTRMTMTRAQMQTQTQTQTRRTQKKRGPARRVRRRTPRMSCRQRKGGRLDHKTRCYEEEATEADTNNRQSDLSIGPSWSEPYWRLQVATRLAARMRDFELSSVSQWFRPIWEI